MMKNKNDKSSPPSAGANSTHDTAIGGSNIAELHYTLDRARELSAEMGLDMMVYLLSMAQCELCDIKSSRVAQSSSCDA